MYLARGLATGVCPLLERPGGVDIDLEEEWNNKTAELVNICNNPGANTLVKH